MSWSSLVKLSKRKLALISALVIPLWVAPLPALAELTLSIVATPDPVEVGETVEMVATITNTDDYDREGVTFELLVPQQVARWEPGNVGGGFDVDCYIGCDPGERMSAPLGTLRAGASKTVALLATTNTDEGLVGDEIPFEGSVHDNDFGSASANVNVPIVADRVLDLTLSEDADPVAPGESLTYTLTFGHSGSVDEADLAATNLELHLPAGVSSTTIDGGGIQDGDLVRWSLGALSYGEGGTRQVSVQLDSELTSGQTLTAEAVLSGGGEEGRALAVTAVDTASPIMIEMESWPNPADLGEQLHVQAKITNISDMTLENVRFQTLVPQEVNRWEPYNVSGGFDVDCYIGCDPGELMTVTLGTMPAGATGIVSFASALQDWPLGQIVSFVGLANDDTSGAAVRTEVLVGQEQASFITETLNVSVSGNGTVTSTQEGIDCGDTCSADFEQDTAVTLNAQPASGWQFSGWSGACSGTGACFVTMRTDRSVTATFTETTAPTYGLSISKSGNGTITSEPAGIDCGSDCTQDYASGTAVTLTATPDADWQFVDWTGVCIGAGATCTLTLDADQSVMATFELNSEPSDLPVVTEWLGSTDEQVDVTGNAGSTTRYIDFGGSDTFTLSADLAGPVMLVDRQATRIILPIGLTIQGAEFVADGVRFTINGYPATLLGNLSDFTFIFAGDAADPDAGFSRRFAEMAADFDASIPAAGAAPVSGTNLGTIQSDGSIAP